MWAGWPNGASGKIEKGIIAIIKENLLWDSIFACERRKEVGVNTPSKHNRKGEMDRMFNREGSCRSAELLHVV